MAITLDGLPAQAYNTEKGGMAMRKIVAVVVVLAVAAMFTLPAFAASCGSSSCNRCAKPAAKPCPTCGQPCNIIQSTANVINNMQAPNLCPKCGTCPKPCNTCPKPCNTCTK